ncbi:MAG: YggT family protein [Steroidobacteraceae bacterium]|nr:YggT family protein [Steroidobacteraceae bacterium]
MNALIFVVDSLFSLAVYAFLLRLLLQLSRADFRNPLSQAVVKLTNWLVLPLRKVLPPIGRVDTASLVAVYVVQVAAVAAVFLISTGIAMPITDLLWWAVKKTVVSTLQLYTVAIVVYALLSLVAPGTYSPVAGLLQSLCEPLLRPVRQVLPMIGGLDFSPLVVILVLQAALRLIA